MRRPCNPDQPRRVWSPEPMTDRPNFFVELLRMSAKIIVGGVLIVALSTCGVMTMVAGAAGASAAGGAEIDLTETETLLGEETASNEILEVLISGVILSHPSDDGGFFGFNDDDAYGYKIKRELEEAAADDTIKGVLLRVSTPGGSIVGSQAIHHGVLAVKEAGKPIVAYVDSLSASGGVWSTAAADAIFADHGSIIGSIGVISGGFMEYTDAVAVGSLFAGVETTGGVKLHITTAGTGKDLGNPFRAPTEDELARMQLMADEFYDKFVAHMAAHRGMDPARVRNEYGASVWANDAAEARGYIDGTRTYEEAASYVAEQAELGDDWRLVTRSEPANPFDFGFGALSSVSGNGLEAAQRLHQASMCTELRSGPIVMSAHHFMSSCGF